MRQYARSRWGNPAMGDKRNLWSDNRAIALHNNCFTQKGAEPGAKPIAVPAAREPAL